MQLLPEEINGGEGDAPTEPGSAQCASAVLNVAPPVVRAIRKIMREHRLPELSVPQFRALGLLARAPDASLSMVADHIGSSLPATSRMIDGLVAKNLIARKECCHDRRQVSLQLTKMGRSAFFESRQATHLQLTEQLSKLSEEQRQTVIEAMKWLGKVFGSDEEIGAVAAMAVDENS
jgi:DNA-binding MarR family transcriptional regulator